VRATTRDGRQRRTWYALAAVTLLVLVAAPILALAATFDDPRVIALTADIARNPREAAPYLARGAYLEANGSPRLAEADFDTAALLPDGLPAADLARAKLFVATDRIGSAERTLARYLDRRPDDEEALRLSGSVRRGDEEARAATDAVALAHPSAAR